MNSLFRSTKPQCILADFGKVFNTSKSFGPVSVLEKARLCSSIDVFFSHVWGSDPKLRYVGLLWYVNAIKAGFSAVILTLVTCFSVLVSLSERTIYKVEATTKLSIQSLTAIYGTVLWCVLLMYMQNIMSWINLPPLDCFLDRCCIEQVDAVEKENGVHQIPTILANSNRLVILLSSEYFDRLWCCYELAVFKSSSVSPGSVSFVPLRLVLVSMLMMMFDLVSILLFSSDIRLQVANQQAIAFLVVSITFSVATALLAYLFAYMWYKDLCRYDDKLRKFSLSETMCSELKDRALLLADIDHRFHGLQSFEKYVQTELRAEIGTNRPKLKYLWFISLPTLLGVLAFIIIVPQRMGLFCLSEYKHDFVTEDFGLCAIIDRARELNYLVITSRIIRFLCYYPVIIQLILLLCELATKISNSKAVRGIIHSTGIACTAILVYFENKGHEANDLWLYHVITSSVTVALFIVLYILPHFFQNKKQRDIIHSKHQ